MYYNQGWPLHFPPRLNTQHVNMHYRMPHATRYTNYNDSLQQQNYAYNCGLPCNQITRKEDPIIAVKKRRHDDENTIENFLQEVEQSGDPCDQKLSTKPSKITFVKHTLSSICKLNNTVKSVCAKLKDDMHLPEQEWQEKINICLKAKCETQKLLETFRDVNFLNEIKKNLEKRKKKRLREKRRRQKWNNEKLLRTERRTRLHAEADAWIRSKQAVIDQEKQEEILRKNADLILSDVRGKRNDARKYLSLFTEIQNLRKVKANIAKARGEQISSADDETFNNFIMNLVDKWTSLDKEYSIEEQELKLMLKTDNDKRIETQEQNIFDDWEDTLFGKKLPSGQSYTDLHSFIMIRSAWDKYINCNNEASPIPIGWLVPDQPSSSAWQKCLKKEFT